MEITAALGGPQVQNTLAEIGNFDGKKIGKRATDTGPTTQATVFYIEYLSRRNSNTHFRYIYAVRNYRVGTVA